MTRLPEISKLNESASEYLKFVDGQVESDQSSEIKRIEKAEGSTPRGFFTGQEENILSEIHGQAVKRETDCNTTTPHGFLETYGLQHSIADYSQNMF